MDDAAAIADLSADALDRRLDPAGEGLIAVAFSGGGDSLALLLGAKAWADRVGRSLLALTVDHRLQPDSVGWARWCADRAARLEVAHRTLVWEGEKPVTGVAAAARTARHIRLADAARAAGARVILMGHTADDRLEARLMRQRGSSVSEPREWTPSPVWPQGRDLFLLRPLLSARRAAIRRRLAAAGETWIEDPANADPRHARARARLDLAGGGEIAPAPPACAPNLAEVLITEAAEIILGSAASGARLLGPALLCASGSSRPPRRDRLEALRARIAAGAPFVATLAGARIEFDGAVVRLCREAGEIASVVAGASPLVVDEPMVWDGRFELRAVAGGLMAAPLAGRLSRLDAAGRRALARLRAPVRKILPAIVDTAGLTISPILVHDPRVKVRCLIESRFLAACGALQNETDVVTHSEIASDTLNRMNTSAMRRFDESA